MHALALVLALRCAAVTPPAPASALPLPSPTAIQLPQDTTPRRGADSLASQQTATPKRLADTVARPLATVRVVAPRSQRGYAAASITSALRTDTPLRDTPRAVTVVTRQLIADQSMQSMADVVRYVPAVSMASGEGHRDAPTIRGNNTTADFFVDGVRDDAQYLRDLYNVERVEVLEGPDAMIFGRGGGGGVINRVLRRAEWAPTHTLSLESGAFDHKRAVGDLGQGLGDHVATRLTGMYERSGGFRDAASLDRWGVNPTLAIAAGSRTMVRLGYERFDDQRRVDRGIPSYAGLPAPTAIETFFGNPDVNHSSVHVNIASAQVEHHTDRGLMIRNRTQWADYDKFYQNTLPRGVDASGRSVTLSAYNHALGRRNLYNGTDLTYALATGSVMHTLLVGGEAIRQSSSQLRLTGWFDDTTIAYVAPLAAPTVSTPVVFRQGASDADNSTLTHDVAGYVQDQVGLTQRLQAVLGLRWERFDISYHDNRTGSDLDRVDHLVSPRAGLVYKPAEPLSLYGSYAVSWLPSSGDQFTKLTVTSTTLEPEKFTNREIGAKWDVRPELALSGALYRLDRTNTSAPDPNDASLTVQTGAQRTTGWELGATGSPMRAWQIVAGVASQRATIVSTTSAAPAGATVPLVPHTSLSLWNRYQLGRRFALGAGMVHRTDVYAAIDDRVTLPGFTRLDAAAYVALRRDVRLQVNVENLLDTRYYATSQGNDNIMPGAPRTLRISLSAGR